MAVDWYWIGTFSNNAKDAGNWSDSLNGPSNGAAPDSTRKLHIGGPGSGAATGQNIVITSTFNCLDFIVLAPATSGNFTISGSGIWNLSGSISLYANCIWTCTSAIGQNTSTTATIDFGGVVCTATLSINGTGTVNVTTPFVSTKQFNHNKGTLTASGSTFTVLVFKSVVGNTRTINCGGGAWKTTDLTSNIAFDISSSGTQCVINTQGSSIECAVGTAVAGKFVCGVHTLEELIITRTAAGSFTISGTPTFTKITLRSTVSHSILFDAASNNTTGNIVNQSSSSVAYTIDTVGLAATHTITFSGALVIDLLGSANVVNRSIASRQAFAGVGSSGTGATNWTYSASSTAYTANLSEAVTLSEAAAMVRAAIVALAGSTALAESLAASMAAIVALSGSTALVEALAVVCAAVVALSANTALSETLGAALAASAGLSEAAVVTEALGALASFGAGLIEASVLAESLAVVRAAVVALSGDTALSELLGAVRAASADLSEGSALGEELGAGAGFSGTMADHLALSEALSSLASLVAGLSEGLSVSEALAALAAYGATLDEEADLEESLGAGADFHASLSAEELALIEAITAAAGFSASVDEAQLQVLEDLAASAGFHAGLSEALLLVELLRLLKSRPLTLTLQLASGGVVLETEGAVTEIALVSGGADVILSGPSATHEIELRPL